MEACPSYPSVPRGPPLISLEVFSERECDHLSSHHPINCAIELVPGVKLRKPKMYSTMPKEMDKLQRYIKKNVARGFIQPAKLRIAAPILFKEKDGTLLLTGFAWKTCTPFR